LTLKDRGFGSVGRFSLALFRFSDDIGMV